MDIQILAPQAGKDYPRNWNEFLDWFATEVMPAFTRRAR